MVNVVACSAFVILTDKHSGEITHLYRYILYTHPTCSYNEQHQQYYNLSVLFPMIFLAVLTVSSLDVLQSLLLTL